MKQTARPLFKSSARSISFAALISSTGSAVRDTRIVSPIPRCSKLPMPIADLISPIRAVPASVTPQMQGIFAFLSNLFIGPYGQIHRRCLQGDHNIVKIVFFQQRDMVESTFTQRLRRGTAILCQDVLFQRTGVHSLPGWECASDGRYPPPLSPGSPLQYCLD